MLDLGKVALAALLHDVGKLLQRGSGAPRLATHTRFGEAFLRQLGYPEAVCEAALRHHGRGGEGLSVAEAIHPETRVVYAADNLASASRREDAGGRGFDPDAPLRSVLGFVRLAGRPEPRRTWAYPAGEYGSCSLEDYMPRPEHEVRADPRSYGGLRERLVEGFQSLKDPLDAGSVMSLLERYGSFVRSTTARADTGDISLYDHARTTAAIAVCIAGHLAETGSEPTLREVERRDRERFLFVRGDISGVQRFIYTITSRGALRMLRARSFFLELLAEHVAAEVLRRAGVPRTNLLFVGGGGFQLLLPNTSASGEAIEGVRARTNAYLAREFGGDLYLALAAEPCTAEGITGEGLSGTLAALARRLSAQKARRFEERLPELFGEPREPAPGTCAVCGRDADTGRYETRGYEPSSGEEALEMCGTCHMLARASLGLVRSAYLRAGRDFMLDGSGYALSEQSRGALYALDGVGDGACLSGAVPLPAARYAAREGDQIADFQTLAKRSRGAQRIAVLRMDVDSLGEIFRSGLPEEMRTFDRYAALSRSFTTFFKLLVPMICAGGYGDAAGLYAGKGEPRNAAVVYSGGDDLFVVGSWSDALELAVDIRRAFRRFACENPSVTLSAGLSIHKSGEPLYLMAERAGAAEEEAKNARPEKDCAVLFYRDRNAESLRHPLPDALPWEEVEKTVELLKQVEAFRDGGRLPFPRGFTRRLLEVTETYEREGQLSLPLLAYTLARMEEAGRLKEDVRWRRLKESLLRLETVENNLRPAALWLDLAEREEGSEP